MTCIIERDTARYYDQLSEDSAREAWFETIQSDLVNELMSGTDAYYHDEELVIDIDQDDFLTELCEVYGIDWVMTNFIKLAQTDDSDLRLEVEKKILDVAEKLIEGAF